MSQKQSLYDYVGDLVIFRDLNPVDARLPGFDEAWADMGMAGPVRPRKHEALYAQAVAWLLRRARSLEAPGTGLAEIVYVGDTALSDGNAFRNLRAAGGWQGWAFIGAERDEELAIREQEGVYVANRWSALADFTCWLREQGALLDGRTAAVIDIDKTALGARGRNDRAIDRARIAAMEVMIADALGPAFNQERFQRAYTTFNAARYHSFTADNQDYLAYISLMITARLCSTEELVADLEAGRLATFNDFLDRIDAQRSALAIAALPESGTRLQALHDEVVARVEAGDPTPFKTFRRREYLETAGRMGCLLDDAPMGQRLIEEICLTREVLDLLDWLRSRGCLLVALSDKPDEASVPTPELAARGYQPLHRALTHIAGQSIANRLPSS